MIHHEYVYKVAKNDDEFRSDLKESGQKLPLFPDSLDKGIWAAAYSGWVLGKHGSTESTRREKQWKNQEVE